MRTAYAVLGWGIIALGVLHMASTPHSLTLSAVWFFSGGMTLVLTGALNLLRRTYGGTAPGLRRFCVGTNVAMTALTFVGGWVSRASIGELAAVVGWMGATVVLSAIPGTVANVRPRQTR